MGDCIGQDVMDFSPASRKGQLTSQAAEDTITKSGYRAKQSQLVFTAIRCHCNGGTSREIAQAGNIEHQIVWRRLNDLAEHDFIRRGEPRKCTVSGRIVLTWWIN